MSKLEKLTLYNLLEYISEEFASNTALASLDGHSINYSELKEKANEISGFLKEQGIVKGDKVAVLGENSINWGIAYLAITAIGAIGVPIMTEFHENEVHHCIRHSEARTIFVSAKYYHKIVEMNYENFDTVILLDDFSIIPPQTETDRIKDFISGGRKEFMKIRDKAQKLFGLKPDEINEEDTALLLYTSGTTGHSKGVMLSHKNIVYTALATNQLTDLYPTDRLLSMLPLFHTFESTMGFVTPLMAGASIYYLDKPPTPTILLAALKQVQPTIMVSVPLVIEKIYRNRVEPQIKKKFLVRSLYKIPTARKKINKAAGAKMLQTFGGKLRMFCIGGAALAYDVEKFLREAEFPYAIGYGLTETSPLASGADNFHTKFKAAGKPIAGVEIKIDNPDPETEEGEILIKGPNVMQGYYKDPDRTAEVLDEDGWFRTGDLGYIDEEGYLFIKGRLKNVIIGPNGKNIYPEELESIINENPFVTESVVFERENKLMAKIHLNYDIVDDECSTQNMQEDEARKCIDKILGDLKTEVNGKLSSFSRIQKFFEQQQPFEKTPTQKIKRYLYTQ